LIFVVFVAAVDGSHAVCCYWTSFILWQLLPTNLKTLLVFFACGILHFC